MSKIKIGSAALNQTPIDWQGNYRRILKAMDQAREEGIQLLCLPELCISGYGCEDLFLSPAHSEMAQAFLKKIIPSCHDLIVNLGLPIRIEDKVYNVNALVKNKQILGFTAKQFLPNEGVHYEARWFESWEANKIIHFHFDGNSYPFGDLIYEVLGQKLAFEICEDAWVGEKRPGFRHKEKGVSIVFNPSASHFAFEKSQFREELIRSSSEILNCTYVYTNMLGNEAGKMIYDGDSMIAHKGLLIQRNRRFSFRDHNMVSAMLDTDKDQMTSTPLTPDPKEKKEELAAAVGLGLFDYMRKSKTKGFVLSISGGADSSGCALLVSEMVRRGLKELGWEFFCEKLNIAVEKPNAEDLKSQSRAIMKELLITAYQASENSSTATFEAAKSLAEDVGATFYHWNIEAEVSGYQKKIEKAIGRNLNWEQDDIALQNIQARARSPIIWMLANLKSALLLTTSNRSEGSVGYATMDGDTSGSLAPIAGIDKAFLLDWLPWAEKVLDYPGMSKANALQPTAELRPPDQDQQDELDLMPYSTLQAIERLALKERLNPLEVYHRLKDMDLVQKNSLVLHIHKFFRLWSQNQWKRERLAPGFHMDDYSIDPRSWCRFPILSGSFEEELAQLASLKQNTKA